VEDRPRNAPQAPTPSPPLVRHPVSRKGLPAAGWHASGAGVGEGEHAKKWFLEIKLLHVWIAHSLINPNQRDHHKSKRRLIR